MTKPDGTLIGFKKVQPFYKLNITIMKTRLFYLLAIVLFAATATFAGVKDVETVTPAAKLLEKEIRYPSAAKDLELSGSVYMTISNKDGARLEFEKVDFDQLTILYDVMRQLKRLEPQLVQLIDVNSSETFRFKFELK